MGKAPSAGLGTSPVANAARAIACSGIVGEPAGCREVELVLPVRHPEQPEVALSLVLCRSAGRLPWYLLTNEAVANEEEAWQVVFAYVRRWQIEQTWRYDKSELADHQSTSVALGGTRETLADGFVGLCLSLEPARAVLRLLAD
jgi:hypothetical protein